MVIDRKGLDDFTA